MFIIIVNNSNKRNIFCFSYNHIFVGYELKPMPIFGCLNNIQKSFALSGYIHKLYINIVCFCESIKFSIYQSRT